jgi:hypothetical protein
MEYFAGLDVSMEETHVCVVTQTALSGTRRRCRLRLPVLRQRWHEFRPVGGSCSKQAGWRRCSTTA